MSSSPSTWAVILAGVILYKSCACNRSYYVLMHVIALLFLANIVFAANVHYLGLLQSFCSLFLDGIIPVYNCDLYWNFLNKI